MKKHLALVSLILLCSLTTINSASFDSVKAASIDDSKLNRSYKKFKKINLALNKDLYEKREKIPMKSTKSKDNLDTSWPIFIKNIHYLKNNQLEIYVTDNFKKINANTRQTIINHVQRFSFNAIAEFKNFDEKDYTSPFHAFIFYDGSCLGHSKYLNDDEFVWND